jgi:GT2 family glycosyltransferase
MMTASSANANPDLEIGVVYTHEKSLMSPLLTTMNSSAPGIRIRLLLVDNASTTGVDAWKSIVADTKVLRNTERLNYAANINRILAASAARYVLAMNTDMFFDPRQQCLTRMVRFMDTHPECGVSGCRLLHADGENAFAARRFQTLPIIAARRFGLSKYMQRTIARYLYQDRPADSTFACDWLSGCFLMFRRQAFSEVGLIDEVYDKYFEDVDICLRMARAGWRVAYYGGTSCFHFEQRASRRLFTGDAWRHFRSYMHFMTKWGLAPQIAEPQPLRAAEVPKAA